MTTPYESFKHGLTVSKIWLCESIEPHVAKNSVVYILGSWTNILSYMLLVRNNTLYKEIFAFDKDPNATSIANEICDTWRFETPHVYNQTKDANEVNFEKCNVVINTSVEHMQDHQWFDNIKPGTLVCFQSSDVGIIHEPWNITNPIKTESELINKYPLSRIEYTGTKEINYQHWGYKRFMLIGYK